MRVVIEGEHWNHVFISAFLNATNVITYIESLPLKTAMEVPSRFCLRQPNDVVIDAQARDYCSTEMFSEALISKLVASSHGFEDAFIAGLYFYDSSQMQVRLDTDSRTVEIDLLPNAVF